MSPAPSATTSSATASCPTSRSLSQIPVSVRTEEERGTFGNQVSIMVVPIPTHLDDPAERLAFANEKLSGAKERHNALPAKALGTSTEFVPPALHTRASRVMLRARGGARSCGRCST